MADLESMTPQERAIFAAGQALFTNPEVSNDAKRLYKKVKPEARFPELDMEDRIAAMQAEEGGKREKLEQQLMRESLERKRADRRRQLTADGYDPDEIEGLIVDWGIAGNDKEDAYARAMKLSDMQRRSAEPTAPDILGPRGNTDLRPEKEWRNLTVQALQNKSGQLAHEMVDEFRKQRRTGRA